MTAFVGGASGSVFAQMFSVPIDIVSQHMMLVGQKGGNCTNKPGKFKDLDRISVPEKLRNSSNLTIAKYISNEIYKNEKLRGFYRGYILSTSLVSINSALWWPFYYFYQGKCLLMIFYLENKKISSSCGTLYARKNARSTNSVYLRSS